MENDAILIRIADKVQKINDDVGEIKVTLSAQHESLIYHIRRTDLLEEAIKPLQAQHSMISGVLKFLGLVFAACAAVEGIVSLMEYLNK